MADTDPFADLIPAKPDNSEAGSQGSPDPFSDLIPKASAPKDSGIVANALAGPEEALTGAIGFFPDAAAYLANKAIKATKENLYGLVNPSQSIETTQKIEAEPNTFNPNATGTAYKAIHAVDPDFDPNSVNSVTPLEKAVREGTGLAAGLIMPGALTESAARIGSGAAAAARPFARAISNYVEPLTQAGQEQIAARTLANGATDRFAAANALDTPDQELIAGSQPTTGQITGDLGILGQERQAETSNPQPFIQRRADQNQARRDELGTFQQTGNPSDVPALFRQQQDQIDQAGQEAEDQATAQAAAQTAAAQTDIDNITSGASVNDETAANALSDAQRQALEARAQLPSAKPPEQVGATLRQSAADARQDAKDQENSLWQTVEKNGPLPVDGSPIRQRAGELLSGLGEDSPPLSGDEKLIFDRAANYPDDATFGGLGQFRSWIQSAARNELTTSGRSPVWGRLTQLQGSVDNAIDSTLQQTAEQQAAQVASGAMAPEDTLLSKLQNHVNEPQKPVVATPPVAQPLQNATVTSEPPPELLATLPARAQQVGIVPSPNDTPENLLAAVHEREAALASPEQSDVHGDQVEKEIQQRFGATLPELTEGVPWADDGSTIPENQVGGQPQAPDGNAGTTEATPVAGETPTSGGINTLPAGSGEAPPQGNGPRPQAAAPVAPPILAQDAIDARKAAATATRNRFQTFDRGTVGSILKPGETADQFKMPDYAVPGTVFHSGEGSFQKIEALRNAAGAQNIDPVLSDYAASDLRNYAMKPDGTLDPNRVFTWQKNHADALRAYPQLNDLAGDIAEAERGVPNALATQKATAKQGAQDIQSATKAAAQTTKTADQAIADAAAARRQALNDYQKGAAGRLLNIDSPDDVTRTIGSIFGTKTANASMKQLADMTGSDPAAKDGVRRSIADYIANKYVGNTEVGASGTTAIKSDQLQTFLRQNQGPLGHFFTPAELDSMNKIAADLQRSNRSNVAMKLPARSNTPQDRAASTTVAQTLMSKMLSRTGLETGLGLGSTFAGGIHGLALSGTAIAASRLMAAARDAGLTKATKLVEQALLNPPLARDLLAKAPLNEGSTDVGRAVAQSRAANRLANRLSGYSMFSAGSKESRQ